MPPDLLRLGFIVILSGVAGHLAGNVFAGLAAGFLLCLLWQQRMLRSISKFLHNGSEQNPPNVPGVVNEITREIDSQRERHTRREEELSSLLARFEEVTEALPDAVVVMDTYGHVEWANEKAFEVPWGSPPQGPRATFLSYYPATPVTGLSRRCRQGKFGQQSCYPGAGERRHQPGTSGEIRYAESSLLLGCGQRYRDPARQPDAQGFIATPPMNCAPRSR